MNTFAHNGRHDRSSSVLGIGLLVYGSTVIYEIGFLYYGKTENQYRIKFEIHTVDCKKRIPNKQEHTSVCTFRKELPHPS